MWPEWVRQRDAAIRARVTGGDEDSIVHLLLFGTAFTAAPRASERDIAALVSRPQEAIRALRRRIDDFAAAVVAPSQNERIRFARAVVERRGIEVGSEAGRRRLLEYLEDRTRAVGGSIQSSRLLDPAAELADKLSLFRDRGLSTDTSIFIDFGIEQALEAITAAGAIRRSSVRRAAIVGPGLDFTDKFDGYDFYPEQTIQPFALVDSLQRLELAGEGLEVTAFDLSPRVLAHVEHARAQARAGTPYSLVMSRNANRPWSGELVEYWRRLGNWIGDTAAKAPAAPPNAGRVETRAVAVRPSVVLSVVPLDLNVVTEQLEPAGGPFDLVIATNILLYYDVFEQSLAAANIARLLRPGGFLLTNNRIFELPSIPLAGAGYTDVVYLALPGAGDAGDRVIWFRKQ